MNRPARIELWLGVIRATGIVTERLRPAIDEHGGLEAALRLGEAAGLDAAARRAVRQTGAQALADDLAWLDQPGHHLVCWDDPRYPPLLRKIPAPPLALFVNGDPDLLWQPQLAVIGSRNPTAGGLDHARAFSAELARRGITVTSGLASGIDSAAHASALESGGQTIAVCGTGPDRVYPESSRALATAISGRGALVTEYPTGYAARRQHFPARNRIIAGLSLGVLVVEAGLNSGTLITARQAAEQGREVFALPGSIHNPMVKGCHRLIREGARLVESVQDILAELGPMASQLAGALRDELRQSDDPSTPVQDAPVVPDDPEYHALWEALAFDARGVEDLVRMTGLGAREISSMLLMLELRGLVAAQAGGLWSRSA